MGRPTQTPTAPISDECLIRHGKKKLEQMLRLNGDVVAENACETYTGGNSDIAQHATAWTKRSANADVTKSARLRTANPAPADAGRT